jgi:hypothetical protein
MTATNRLPPADRPQRGTARVRHWLVPAVLLALAPKCLLCIAGYVAAGAALRLGGAELCGAPAGAGSHWTSWLPALGLLLGAAGYLAQRWSRHA